MVNTTDEEVQVDLGLRESLLQPFTVEMCRVKESRQGGQDVEACCWGAK